MMRLVTILLATVAACGCAERASKPESTPSPSAEVNADDGSADIMRARQKGALFPALNPEQLNEFKQGTYEEFVAHDMVEDRKVGYALALAGYWLVNKNFTLSKSYNDLARELAGKYGLKNEEGQSMMGAAMIAEASGEPKDALRQIESAIIRFEEMDSKRLIIDAMFYKAGLHYRSSEHADAVETFEAIEKLADGPGGTHIRTMCRTAIQEIESLATKSE